MVSRQRKAENTMQELADRLIKLYEKTGHQNNTLAHLERAALAAETIQVWWEVYDHFVFWAQCELLGQDLLRQNFDLLVMLRDRGLLRLETERRLSEALGYYFSLSDKHQASEALLPAVGAEQLEVVKLLAKAGPGEPGAFLRHFLIPNTKVNTYLQAELTRLSDNIPEPTYDIDRDLDHAHPTETTKWKLEALRQVRSLVGQGLKKIAATSEVSAAIRHSIDELQVWERDLVKFSDFENDLFCAELAGEFEDELRASHYSNIRNYRFYGSFNGVYNLERASTLAHHMRQIRMSDIMQGLRSVR